MSNIVFLRKILLSGVTRRPSVHLLVTHSTGMRVTLRVREICIAVATGLDTAMFSTYTLPEQHVAKVLWHTHLYDIYLCTFCVYVRDLSWVYVCRTCVPIWSLVHHIFQRQYTLGYLRSLFTRLYKTMFQLQRICYVEKHAERQWILNRRSWFVWWHF